MLQYLQNRPSSQHGAIHNLRGKDVPVPASVDGLRPASINSGIVEFDVEEGVPGANLPRKGTKLATMRSLSLGSDDNAPGPDPFLSEGLPRTDKSSNSCGRVYAACKYLNLATSCKER